MEKNPDLPATHPRRAFEGWLRVLNPFVFVDGSEANARRLSIRWGRLILLLITIGVGCSLSLAAAGYLFLRHEQHLESIGYLDVLLPSRWARIRKARGDRQVEVAQRLLKTGHSFEAFLPLKLSVDQSPANRDGRLLFAQLLVEAGRPEVARRVLLGGLPYLHEDPAYLGPLFSFLFQQQGDATAIAVARKFLPRQPAATEAHRLFSLAAATAGYFRGNYDLAEDFLRAQPNLAASRDGLLLASKIERERGYPELALLRLRELAAAYPHDVEIHSELASHLERADLHDEVRRVALAFQIAHPALPGPRLKLIRAFQNTGDHERATQEIEAFVRDFGSDAAALLSLADFAANTGDAPLARRLLDVARAHTFPWEPHAILAVEALVVSRDFHGTLEAARELLRDHPDWNARFGPVLISLQAIAHFGLGETESGSLLLTSYLNQSYLRAENLLAIAQRLVDVDAAESARQTLLRAIAADPLNQAAITRLVELDLNLNRIDELPAHLMRLLAMRKPSPDILRVAQYKLGSDLFLFNTERPAALEAIRVALENSSRTPPRS